MLSAGEATAKLRHKTFLPEAIGIETLREEEIEFDKQSLVAYLT